MRLNFSQARKRQTTRKSRTQSYWPNSVFGGDMVAGLPGEEPRRGSSTRGTAADPAAPLLIGSRLAKKSNRWSVLWCRNIVILKPHDCYHPITAIYYSSPIGSRFPSSPSRLRRASKAQGSRLDYQAAKTSYANSASHPAPCALRLS